MNYINNKSLYSNLIQNLLLTIISIVYFKVPEIKGSYNVAFVILLYLTYFIFLLIEFYNYEKIKTTKAIKGYNIFSFIIVQAYMLGGIDLLTKDYGLIIMVLLILINLLRFVIFYLYLKRNEVKFNESYKETDHKSEKLNIQETLVLVLSFITLVINLSTKIQLLISLSFITTYFIIFNNKINNFKINYILSIVLIVLSYFDISGIVNYSIFGLIFMLLFRRK
ncbi:MAG: hypothetical protein Q4B23_06515 [Helcococcus sp.]|nr:hypothetical protein [Helcococcus sp.]